MMNKYCFEAFDKSMQDILRFNNPQSMELPFGVKTVVFGRDFRQILPVIPKGSRQDIVLAAINSSYLWKNYKVLRLFKNMRLQNIESNAKCVELNAFSDWIASIGDVTIGCANDGHATIEISDDMLLRGFDNPVKAIVDSMYPLFTCDVNKANYLQGRAILAPTLDVVELSMII